MRPGKRTGLEKCPDPELWVRLAAGLSDPVQSDSLVSHASNCQQCADRLRDLLDAVREGYTPDAETDKVIGDLAIQSVPKRHRLSMAMAARNRPPYWIVAVAAMLLVALSIGGWYIGTWDRSVPPLRLLAKAYSSSRTMELEISGAAYAPLQVERGTSSLSDLPATILESQLRIKQRLERKPDDPEWLHAQGRAQLLLWQFDAAIRSFQTAADLGANSPEFLIDFASAYYQRAERNSVALDYSLALEKLGQALQKQPNDPAALFNRSIIYGKLHQYDAAIADLERCLRLEKDPGWRGEARQRMEGLRKLQARLFDPGLRESGDLQAELDLESAMVSELSRHFHQMASGVDKEAVALLDRHQDPWLRDVSKLSRTPGLTRAVDDLSRMTQLRTVVSSDYGHLDNEIRWLEAARLPKPLRVWRDYELLYRDTRTQAVARCGDNAPLIAIGRTYPWFEAQILLESSLCRVGRQDFMGAALLVDEAEQIAKRNHLNATLIRVPNFRGQRLAELGFFREAIQTATDALATIEAGSYPLRRAYDFHGIVMLVATQLGLPNTGYGASLMMARIGQRASVPLFEMVGHCRRAGFALALGRKNDADDAYRSAQTVFRRLGENPTARIYWRTAELSWLELHKDRDTLYRMLRDVRKEAPDGKENLYFDRKLIATLCRLELKDGHPAIVEAMVEPFWNDVTETNVSRQSTTKAFRPEIESASQSLTEARLIAGRHEGALKSWQRFIEFDRQLLGGGSQSPSDGNDDSAILTVAGLRGKAALWLRANGRTEFWWASEPYSVLVRRARLLRRLCSLSTVPTSRISSEARTLYGILFPKGIGNAPRVYLEARGELNSLPLSTFLLLGKGQNTTFSFLPFGRRSVERLEELRNTQVTVIAATEFDAKLDIPTLPAVEEEIAGIRSAYRNTVVLQGHSATARALEGAAMTHGVLHFVGHAVPWHGAVGLVVAPDVSDPTLDGRIGIWTMKQPRLISSDLVVFSACGTGVFEDASTVQPGQLTVAMLLAGTRQVVATLWDVDSYAAAAWSKAFYSYLAAGEPTTVAVWRASKKVRSMAGWQHPRYWAAFTLYES